MRQAVGLQLENGYYPGRCPGVAPGWYEPGRWPEGKWERAQAHAKLKAFY